MPNPLVIDISHHQQSVDFPALFGAGTRAVILKATENTGYIDPTFKDRRIAADRVGMSVAAYHFMRPGNIAAQMTLFLNTVNPAPGERLILDYEDPKSNIAELEQAVNYLNQQVPGVEITVYGANGCLGAHLGGKKSPLLSAKTSLWVASYTTKPEPTMTDLKATWPVWSLWQYTDAAKVEGSLTPVDANRWNGNPDDLAKWFDNGDARQPSPPVPEQPAQAEYIQITVPKGQTIIVNGTKFTG